jgi:hexulose-6-phosphate isomerase
VIAEELGVNICVEFIQNGLLFSPMETRRFLDEINHPRVGFYFDPGNMAVFQFPHHWVRIVGRHIQLVHLKDWTGHVTKGGWTALLEGSIDFPAVMRELRAIGYDGPLTAEVEPHLASFEKTAEAVRKIRTM